LTVNLLEQDAILRETVNIRGVDVRIAVAPQRIETLLVRANPEDIGARMIGHSVIPR
jgi:hypothetical protein